MVEWILENANWLFSGVAVAIIGALITFFVSHDNNKNNKEETTVSGNENSTIVIVKDNQGIISLSDKSSTLELVDLRRTNNNEIEILVSNKSESVIFIKRLRFVLPISNYFSSNYYTMGRSLYGSVYKYHINLEAMAKNIGFAINRESQSMEIIDIEVNINEYGDYDNEYEEKKISRIANKDLENRFRKKIIDYAADDNPVFYRTIFEHSKDIRTHSISSTTTYIQHPDYLYLHQYVKPNDVDVFRIKYNIEPIEGSEFPMIGIMPAYVVLYFDKDSVLVSSGIGLGFSSK